MTRSRFVFWQFIKKKTHFVSHRYANANVMQKYGRMLEQYTTNDESLNVAIMTMMYHIAGDCNREDVLLQLPILKTFMQIWGDLACTKYVRLRDIVFKIMPGSTCSNLYNNK